jgi:hypothetical protein
MMLFLIVSATRAPARTAPKNSKMDAASRACFMVSDLELTLVANELLEESTNRSGHQRRKSLLCNIICTNIERVDDGLKGGVSSGQMEGTRLGTYKEDADREEVIILM